MRTLEVQFLVSSILVIAFVSGVVLPAHADTFTSKETGESFNGTLKEASMNGKRLVVKEDGTRIYLDLSKYEVIHNDPGQLPVTERDGQDTAGKVMLSVKRGCLAYIVPISGSLLADRGVVASLDRCISLARKSKANVLVLVIDSGGGHAATGEAMATQMLKVRDMNTISFVKKGAHGGAFSAAALLAFSCKRIVMEPGSCIGAATPYVPGMQTIPEVQEKFTSASSAIMRATAEQADHSPELAEAMVDAKTSLFCVTGTGDEFDIVRAYDEEEALRRTSVKAEEVKDVVHFCKEGTLLTLTDSEAVKNGLSVGSYVGLAEVMKGIGCHTTRFIGGDFPCGACMAKGYLPCPRCNGTGREYVEVICRACGGEGGSYQTVVGKRTTNTYFVACTACGGKGNVWVEIGCALCNPNSIKFSQIMRARGKGPAYWVGKMRCPYCDGQGATK